MFRFVSDIKTNKLEKNRLVNWSHFGDYCMELMLREPTEVDNWKGVIDMWGAGGMVGMTRTVHEGNTELIDKSEHLWGL